MIVICRNPAPNWVSPLHLSQTKHSIKHNNKFLPFKCSYTSPCISNTYIDSSYTRSQILNQPIKDHNTQIRKFCEMGSLNMAMDLIVNSRESKLEVATYCSMLQLCADLKSLDNGRKVRSVIDSDGVKIDGVLGSKLVFMYVSCGDLREGRRVFDDVANDKVFLWNLLINEYAKNGEYDEGASLYRKMLDFGVRPNSHTFSCVLKCFGAKRSIIVGETLHGYLLKLGFDANITVVNSLIAFYFKCGRTESACKVFDEIGDRDIITWNSMISGCAANSLAEKSVEIFIQMLNSEIMADLVTLLSVLTACSSIGILLLGNMVHAYAIKTGFDRKLNLKNTLIDMYFKCGDSDSATRVLRTMDEREIVSYTSMISGYARHGLYDNALLLFDDMKREGVKLDNFIVTSILHACACCGSLEKGKEVHNYIKESNMNLSLPISNALIYMYAKCGSMEEAQSIFSEMSTKDIISWNTMINGYAKNNYPNEAFSLFTEMHRKIKPDCVTMACILPACASLAALGRGKEIHCHILRNGISGDIFVDNALINMYVKCGDLTLAQSLFNLIPRKDLVSWTIMIVGYAMHGEGGKAIATFNEMRKTGIEPNVVSFVSIICACSHSRLVFEGLRFFNIMRYNCKIEPNLEHYACIVDLLAKSGKLSEAYRFIETMPIKPDANVWGALLLGCRIYQDVKLAELVADHVFELEPDNMRYYVLLAEIYADAEEWEKSAKSTEKIDLRSFNKNTG